MSTGKSTNLDSCRDLSGRRLSTIKEAQRSVALIALCNQADLDASIRVSIPPSCYSTRNHISLSSLPPNQTRFSAPSILAFPTC